MRGGIIGVGRVEGGGGEGKGRGREEEASGVEAWRGVEDIGVRRNCG